MRRRWLAHLVTSTFGAMLTCRPVRPKPARSLAAVRWCMRLIRADALRTGATGPLSDPGHPLPGVGTALHGSGSARQSWRAIRCARIHMVCMVRARSQPPRLITSNHYAVEATMQTTIYKACAVYAIVAKHARSMAQDGVGGGGVKTTQSGARK